VVLEFENGKKKGVAAAPSNWIRKEDNQFFYFEPKHNAYSARDNKIEPGKNWNRYKCLRIFNKSGGKDVKVPFGHSLELPY
jgi:hypothetical protein